MPEVYAHSNTGSPAPIAPYSIVSTYGDLIYLAGHLPMDEDGRLLSELSAAKQTTNTMQHMEKSLKAAGSDFDHLLKVNIFATAVEEFPEINEAYIKFFGDHLPARATVEVSRLVGDVKVEIEGVAVRRSE